MTITGEITGVDLMADPMVHLMVAQLLSVDPFHTVPQYLSVVPVLMVPQYLSLVPVLMVLQHHSVALLLLVLQYLLAALVLTEHPPLKHLLQLQLQLQPNRLKLQA
jgi:hypothetical protein